MKYFFLCVLSSNVSSAAWQQQILDAGKSQNAAATQGSERRVIFLRKTLGPTLITFGTAVELFRVNIDTLTMTTNPIPGLRLKDKFFPAVDPRYDN